MDIEQFEELVDEFGEFPAGWPDNERAEAISLLNSSQKAREIVAEAAALRHMFQRSEPVIAPAGLANRIAMLAGDADKRLTSRHTNRLSSIEGSKDPLGSNDLFGPKDILTPKSFVASKRLVASKGFPLPAFLNNGGSNYIVLCGCFVVGLGLGLGLGFLPLYHSNQIDFATLFAVVGS